MQNILSKKFNDAVLYKEQVNLRVLKLVTWKNYLKLYKVTWFECSAAHHTYRLAFFGLPVLYIIVYYCIIAIL